MGRLNIVLWTLLPVVTAFMIGCGGESYSNESSSYSENLVFTDSSAHNIVADTDIVGLETGDGSVGSESIEVASVAVLSERKLIKRGNIAFSTPTPDESYRAISLLVRQNGGFIAEERRENRFSDTEPFIYYFLTLRIPSEFFDRTVESIVASGNELDEKVITVDDVTLQWIDTRTRIENRKAIEARYMELLGNVTELNEIIRMEQALGNIRLEIESAEQQFLAMQDQVSYSTLNVEFYQPVEPTQDTKPSYIIVLGERIAENFLNGAQGLIDFFVGLINIWPLIIIGFFIPRLIKWGRTRWQVRKKGGTEST